MQPNILIFMSDQHSGLCMGYRGADVDTPNLDNLARCGTSFDNAYTPCPLCVPARMSFVSGKSPRRTGIYTNSDTIPDTMPTFLHALVAAGYETVLVGRMHFVGNDQRHGFTKRIEGEFTPTGWNRPEILKKIRGPHIAPAWAFALNAEQMGGGESCITYYDRDVTKAALDYLAQSHDKPQCIVVGTYGPHFPYIATRDIYEKYKARVKLPEDFYEWHEDEKTFTKFLYHRNLEATEEQAMQAKAGYYALVEIADKQVGAVRKAFKEMCEREGRRRLFMYTSDHGDMNGHKGLYGKHVFFEDSACIPMLVEGDGIPADRRISDNVSLIDVSATVIDAAGAEALSGADGKSLMGYFTDEYKKDDERIVTSEIYESIYPHEYRFKPFAPDAVKQSQKIYGIMLRKGDYKYIRYAAEDGDTAELMYDIAKDPSETENVLPEHRELANELRSAAMSYQRVERVLSQQRERAANAKLFRQYEKAVDQKPIDLWTNNPPEGRLPPTP